MQDLRRNRRRMSNKQTSIATKAVVEETAIGTEEMERGCKGNKNGAAQNNGCHKNNNVSNVQNNGCNKNNNSEVQGTNANTQQGTIECNCTFTAPVAAQNCEPCQVESDVCVANPCSEECCSGISPTYTTRNACPVAIEANTVYDAAQFRVFTDATGPNGENLAFDYEVVSVRGNVPSSGLASFTVDEVCMNYSSIEVIPGEISVEGLDVDEVPDDIQCDTVFEYSVCPNRNSRCCSRNLGQNLSYKERGLTTVINDLVLEIKGHCGCTKVVAYAYPAVVRGNGQLVRIDCVECRYNTLAARICVPSSGKPVILRQEFRTTLSVDCISKGYITKVDDYCDCDCDCGCDYYSDYELTLPSGIDLICCVEETISVLVNTQLVVLATTDGISPRVVDTFSNLCNFPECGREQ